MRWVPWLALGGLGCDVDAPFTVRDDGDEDACLTTELPYDGLDNDCDPVTRDDDLDDDGYLSRVDCDDLDPGRPSDEVEGDGIDNDCDARVDCADADLIAATTVVWEGDAEGEALVALGDLCESPPPGCLDVNVTGSVQLTRTPARLTCLAEVSGDLVIGPDEPPPGSGDLRVGVDVTTLAPLGRLRSVGGTLTVQNNDALATLDGLQELRVANGLAIGNNGVLESVEALSAASVSGDVSIRGNRLLSLRGLEGATVVRELWISEYRITSLDGLDGLRVVSGDLTLVGSNVTSLAGLEGLEVIGGSLVVTTTPIASLTELASLESYGGLVLSYTDLTTLEGLPRVDEVDGDVTLVGNAALTSTTGLGGLRDIGGDLTIGAETLYLCPDVDPPPGNVSLVDVVQLHGLESVAGSVTVGCNSALGNDAAQALVDAIDWIGGETFAANND